MMRRSVGPSPQGALLGFAANAGDGADLRNHRERALGIGGDRLTMWPHPVEVAAGFSEGGWTPEQIAENWAATMGAAEQTYGI
jgi:hypothetical protein